MKLVRERQIQNDLLHAVFFFKHDGRITNTTKQWKQRTNIELIFNRNRKQAPWRVGGYDRVRGVCVCGGGGMPMMEESVSIKRRRWC